MDGETIVREAMVRGLFWVDIMLSADFVLYTAATSLDGPHILTDHAFSRQTPFTQHQYYHRHAEPKALPIDTLNINTHEGTSHRHSQHQSAACRVEYICAVLYILQQCAGPDGARRTACSAAILEVATGGAWQD